MEEELNKMSEEINEAISKNIMNSILEASKKYLTLIIKLRKI